MIIQFKTPFSLQQFKKGGSKRNRFVYSHLLFSPSLMAVCMVFSIYWTMPSSFSAFDSPVISKPFSYPFLHRLRLFILISKRLRLYFPFKPLSLLLRIHRLSLTTVNPVYILSLFSISP